MVRAGVESGEHDGDYYADDENQNERVGEKRVGA